MTIITNNLESIPLIEFPTQLHTRIISKIIFKEHVKKTMLLFAVLAFDLTIFGWHFYAYILREEVFGLAKFLLQDFELNSSFLSDFYIIVKESLPLFPAAMLFITILLVMILTHLIISEYSNYKTNIIFNERVLKNKN